MTPLSHEKKMKSVPVEVTGTDIPPPAKSFSEIVFSAQALEYNIRRFWKVDPSPIQRYAIPVAMAGRDLMACAQAGSGKTMALCVPIINEIILVKQRQSMEHRLRALILAPTGERVTQIYLNAKKFSYKTGVIVVPVYDGAHVVYQLRNLELDVDILVATPGHLVDMIERSKDSLKNIKYLALDEADRMLDMGFEPQVRKIVQQMEMPPPGSRQTMLFSATFPAEIQRLASDFLSNYIFLAVGNVGSRIDLIVQKVEYVHDTDKRDYLVNLLRCQEKNMAPAKDALTLVFVETERGADALERWLCRKGFPSAAIHSEKKHVERERALKSFRSRDTPILVATDVAAQGLDIPHVAHVINFDLPRAVDDYVHRIGRTRNAGLATAFFCEKNAPLAKALVELMQEANQEVPVWLTEYFETSSNVCDNGRRHGGGYGCVRNDYSSQFADVAEKKKLCMVCCGPEIDDCEIVVLDIQSDLKDRFCDDDKSDPIVLTPIVQLSRDLLGIEAFCVLGSTLFMFEDGFVGMDDRLSIFLSDKRKSAYAFDFGSSPTSSSARAVQLEQSNVRKLSDMCGPKACTRAAAPTPDGERIVVYSSQIQYDPCDDINHVKRIDFEVYNADLDRWVELPGLAEKLVDIYGEGCYTYYVDAFNFVHNSKILTLVNSHFFSLDLDDEEKVEWRVVVDVRVPMDNVCIDDSRFFLLEYECLQFCVTPKAIFDNCTGRSCLLPFPRFDSDYSVCVYTSSAHVTRLTDSEDGECMFARVHMGKSEFTNLPHLVVDVFSFNFDMYMLFRAFRPLDIHHIKSSEFVLGTSARHHFAGIDIFSILAGIDMPISAGVPERTGLRFAHGPPQNEKRPCPEEPPKTGVCGLD